jgi:hypothetical protein
MYIFEINCVNAYDWLYKLPELLGENPTSNTKELFEMFDKYFQLDTFSLQREGINKVSHICGIYDLPWNSNNVIDVYKTRGDIIKNLSIEGVKITGYTVTIGNTNIITRIIDETDNCTVYLGKIGIVLLMLRFQEVKIKINCEKLTSVKGTYICLPSDSRRQVAMNEFFDDSIEHHLSYGSGCCKLLNPKDIMFTSEECENIRRIIDNNYKGEKLWLQKCDSVLEMIKARLPGNYNVSGNMVTMGIYKKGDTLQLHKDYPLQGGSHSILIYLNYTSGGETVFGDTVIQPASGLYKIFDIYLEHEMLELKSDKKYIIACELQKNIYTGNVHDA